MARRRALSPPQPQAIPISAAYVRVSRVGGRGEAGEGEFLSPALQREAAINLSKVHGWQFDDELTTKATDLDVSGRKGNLHKRTGLAALLEAARDGRVQHVIVYKLSRLARSAREGLEIFDQFEALGVAVHVVKEGIDSSTASGRMIRTMLLGVAEMQSEDISQFAKDAAMQRALQGRPHRTPGWIRRGESGAYELVPELAASMRRLIALRMSGLSYSSIARIMNTEKLPSPTGAIWRANNIGQYLSPDNLHRLVGTSVFGTEFEPGDSRRIEIKDAFPALLTQEEFAALVAVQKVLLEDLQIGDSSGSVRKAAYAPLLASGLLSCAICGSPMRTARQGHINTDGGQSHSYICSGAGELGVSHPTYGRSMAKTATGEPDQRQMSISGESVEASLLLALLVLGSRLLPDLPLETIPQKSTDGLSTGGFSICGKLGYGKSSFFEGSVDGAILDFQPYTRARARSSSSSVSISSSLESKTYETKDDDDRLPKRASTHAHTRKEQHRTVEAITRDIDDLFDLRGKITDGDWDRRYQRLASEREESQRRQAELEATQATGVGRDALRVLLSPTESLDGAIDETSIDRWKLAAKLLLTHVQAPLFLPDALAKATGDHKDRTSRQRRALIAWLRTPLESGEVVVVSGLYRSSYSGPRFCQLLTEREFSALFPDYKTGLQ